MKRVSIVNCYGDVNRGSAALNAVAIRAAKTIFPDAQIRIIPINDFSDKERSESFRHTLKSFPDVQILPPMLSKQSLRGGAWTSTPLEMVTRLVQRHRWVNEATADFIEGSDLVISRGGVVYYAPRGGLPGLLRRTSAMRWAQAKAVPTMHLGLHAMEVESALGARLVSEQFSSSRILLPRGPLSHEWVKRYAPNAVSLRTPDSVLSFHPTVTVAGGAFVEGQWAVSITEGSHVELEEIIELVNRGSRHGLLNQLMVVVQVGGAGSDIQIAKELVERVRRVVAVELIDDDLSVEALIELYSRMSIVLSTRLHAAILGLIAGVPSLVKPVGKRLKDIDVFSEIGLGEWVLDQPSLDDQWRVILAASQPEVRARVHATVEHAAERHREALLRASKIIEEGS